MSFLRLAVDGAIFDDEGRVLLSDRGDLNIWNLPGGRLDSGEALAEAAAREVREETGIVAHIERAVGLYYARGWNRLNVLYAGWPLGGELQQRTNETRANGYFDPQRLPERMLWPFMVEHAQLDTRPLPYIVETAPGERRRVKFRLALRWLGNLMTGHLEPRHVRFNVQAVALVWDEAHRSVLTLPGARARVLPRVVCDGHSAPWEELAETLRAHYPEALTLYWVGMWHHAADDSAEFIFAASVVSLPLDGGAEWSTGQNAALMGLDAEYVSRVRPSFATDPVWTITFETRPQTMERIEVELPERGTT